ncbi:MAG: hypothetical protein LBV69_07330 [Bacteroidales bacterium]|jgi:hypothetical protein|nr:hypothetical protein [Bacteroidales bacterium]
MSENKNNDKTIVFRLQDDGTQHGLENTIKGWEKSKMYDDWSINSIESSNINSTTEPTSIPTPFARIALAKTAFAEVSEYGEKAPAIYKKIVSDCLDVAEIFFTFDKWKSQITILKWIVGKDLDDLKNTSPIFYKTLKTFLETDTQAYNFDRMTAIYMLKHNQTGQILGATSPCTLFFSSANKFKGKDIMLSNNHYAFSGDFPLHKRGWEFQKFLYTWMAASKRDYAENLEYKKNNDNKSKYDLFFEFEKYLDKQRDLIRKNSEEIARLKSNAEEYIVNYVEFPPEMKVEILEGWQYYKQKMQQNDNITSDFEIDSKIYNKNNPMPLALPNTGGVGTKYYNWTLSETAKWEDFEAKYEYEELFDSGKRILPDGTVYHFLTISDFLTDSIVRLPYTLNDISFFDGNITHDDVSTYLLPLSENFFKFFSAKDLMTKKFGDKPMLELKTILGGVKVYLRIPVKKRGEYVEYIRVYYETIDEADIENNDGRIIYSELDFAIFPNFDFKEDKDAYYRFELLTPKGKFDNFKVSFYNQFYELDNIQPVLNPDNKRGKDSQTYALNGKKFDSIFIKDEEKGVVMLVVPTFSKYDNHTNHEEFTFAVDLGTTNTHIEYTIGTSTQIKPFDITVGDKQILISNDSDDIIRENTELNLIPEIIGTKGKTGVTYKFPIRTVLSTIDNFDSYTKEVYPFVQANLAIPYQKMEIKHAITQIKWSTNTKYMKYFVDCLCFIMRNKVLLNHGNLAKTKIVWLYPLSMEGQRRKRLENVWNLAYAKYFLGKDVDSMNELDRDTQDTLSKQLIPLTESEAPYLFYKELKEYKINISNLVSIDIGGGTTDVVFVEDKKLKYMSSFRFAANDIFGIGEDTRKMVDKYKIEFENILKEHDRNFELENLYNSIVNEKVKNEKKVQIETGDIASFFFSLLENEILDKNEVNRELINFQKYLESNENQRLVFVLFYVAIIYHIAQIAKKNDMKIPRHIAFSGNGSRLITVIADNDLLEELSKLIFKDVYKNIDIKPLTIIHNITNPKEVSAKGGIKAADKNYDPPKYKTLVLLPDNKTTYNEMKTDEDATIIAEEAQNFIKYVLDNLLKEKYTRNRKEQSFADALTNLRVLNIAEEVRKRNADFVTWAKNGIIERMSELDDKSQKIEETFFFYPLVGYLQTLSNEIEEN